MEAHYRKFLDMIRVVRINIPLLDFLAGMRNCGKFLKELVSNKHKLDQISSAFLSDESSAMIQNKDPPKIRDPESFLIPCTFDKAFSCNALADLGASINLMSARIIEAYFWNANNQAVDNNGGGQKDPNLNDKQEVKMADDQDIENVKDEKGKNIQDQQVFKEDDDTNNDDFDCSFPPYKGVDLTVKEKGVIKFSEVGANKDNKPNNDGGEVGYNKADGTWMPAMRIEGGWYLFVELGLSKELHSKSNLDVHLHVDRQDIELGPVLSSLLLLEFLGMVVGNYQFVVEKDWYTTFVVEIGIVERAIAAKFGQTLTKNATKNLISKVSRSIFPDDMSPRKVLTVVNQSH
uniref:Reverse transcriptase domain-containing protein n=1 Tax=Tanacetum cinerariifolium TaxID=118510 RepID=A0A6L2KSG7_TANCI|nr:reverse transcriptase domain-containing protein [Tanacetum cinerariifolium]